MQNLSSLPPVIDNIFDKYNKNLVPIRSLSDHDILPSKWHVLIDVPFLQQRTKMSLGVITNTKDNEISMI